MGAVGKLVLITGPMFSGKTTGLIKEIYLARKAGRRAVILKSALDTRYSTSYAVSHDGLKLPARVLPEGKACVRALNEIARDYDVIGIDEAHFWDDTEGFVDALDRLASRSKTIYVSMLNRESKGSHKAFRISKELLPLVDKIYFLSAKCAKCGADAAFTERTTRYKTTGKKRYVGGTGDYEARCRRHLARRPAI